MLLLEIIIIGFISGFLVKLTDDIADKNLKIKKFYSLPTGLAYGFCMGYLMLIDSDTALLFGGIILGCLVTGKINSPGHYFGLASAIAVVFLYAVRLSHVVFLISAFAALDETKGMIRVPVQLGFIFDYRLILKLGILILVILEILGPNALIALLAFDAAYILAGRITSRYAREM